MDRGSRAETSFYEQSRFRRDCGNTTHGKQRVDDRRGPQWYVHCKDSARRATDAEMQRILRKKAKPTASSRSTQSKRGPTKAGAAAQQLAPVTKRVPTAAPQTKMSSKKKMSSNVNWLQADDFDDGHDWDEDYFDEDDY